MGSGICAAPQPMMLVEKDNPKSKLFCRFTSKFGMEAYRREKAMRKEQIMHAIKFTTDESVTPVAIYWNGSGVMKKAGDHNGCCLEAREAHFDQHNDVIFWQTLPHPMTTDIITRWKLNKDGTITPTCHAGRNFCLGKAYNDALILLPKDSKDKVFFELQPHPDFDPTTAPDKQQLKSKVTFMGVYEDKTKERAMPDFNIQCWVNKNKKAPESASGPGTEPDSKVLSTLVHEIIDECRRRKIDEAYIGIQYGARLFKLWGADDRFQKYGKKGETASGVNSNNELNMPLSKIEGTINVVGGPEELAVYKITYA